MRPKVDIIVLVHNGLKITEGFVDLLFKNTSNFNLIFIDNGSTDGTPKFLSDGESKSLWSVVRPGSNIGIIQGRNLGVTFSKEDFFLNIDNDQYPGENWLDMLYEHLVKNNCHIVGCEAWCLNPPTTKKTVVIGNSAMNASYYPFRRCVSKNEKFTYIGCGGMLIDKNVYKAIGLFDEQFSPAYFEDPDFSFRAIQNKFKLGWNPDCPIKHLAHQTVNSQKSFDKNKQFLSSWQKFQKKWYPYFPGDNNDR